MKDIIDWLIKVEDATYKVYKKAASQFSDDREFFEFLSLLCKDEKEHCDFVYEAKKISLKSMYSCGFLFPGIV